MRKYTNEPSRKAIAEDYLAEQALRKEAADISQAKTILVALELAKKSHDWANKIAGKAPLCRSVLGLLPISGMVFKFECCDCHQEVAIPALEASMQLGLYGG